MKPLCICIVGLLPAQQQTVTRKTADIPSKPELRFYDSHTGTQQLPQHVDFVLCSKFCRHSWWHRAKEHVDNDHVFFMDGGTTKIIEKIFTLTGFSPEAIKPTTEPQPTEVMPRGIYDRTKMKKRTVESYSSNPAPVSDRIRWTPAEIKAIAEEWVLQRLDDPLASAGEIFERAQRKALPGERQRSLPGVGSFKPLQEAITLQWKAYIERPSAPPAPLAPPEPQVVTLEIPRKLTAAEMLAEMDEASLAGLLAAKQLQRQARHDELLLAIATQAGAANLPKAQAFIPHLEAFAPAKKAPPRIAVVGQPAHLNEPLVAAASEAGLVCTLRFPDAKDKDTVARCDYAIIIRQPGTNGSSGDRAIGELGRNRVALLDAHEVTGVLQQVRNFCTRT